MPYGIAKSKGGDKPSNVSKMESCVSKVMARPGFKPQAGRDAKASAIAICKRSLGFTKETSVMKKRAK